MKRAEKPSAIRILPPDDTVVLGSDELGTDAPRRWRTPGVIAGVVLAAFLFTTRSSGTVDSLDAPSLAPPLAAAEIETENVDLTQPAVGTEGWIEASPEAATEIDSLLRHSSILAIGSSGGDAQAWVSGNGGRWRTSIDPENPDRPTAGIDHAVYWNGAVVALSLDGDSAGIWRSRSAGNWQYEGEFTGVKSQSITGLVGGVQLLAIESFDGGVQAWASPDAQQWASLGMLDTLSGISINSLAATDQWYFVGGSSAAAPGAGKPVIYRSSDGIGWEPVDGEGPGTLTTTTGQVTALTTHNGTAYATGSTTTDAGTEVAMWQSEDGVRWDRIGADAAALLPTTISMRAQGGETVDNARATIFVNGERHVVSVGSEITTDDTTLLVDNITERLVQISHGDEQISLVVNMHRRAASTPLTVSGQATTIAVEGRRIVLAGSVQVGSLTTPATWLSTDAGQTWERSTIRDSVGQINDVVTAGANIVVLTETGDGPEIWRNTWNTQAMADRAGAITTRFVEALNARDLDTLTGLLPSAGEMLTSPKFAIPSLGSYNQTWWDADTGAVDADRVRDTLDYLDATESQVDLADCRTGVGLSSIDRTMVTCEFVATSTLLSTLEIEGEGRLRGAFTNGVFEGVLLDIAPANLVWESLAAGVGGTSTAESQTLVSIDENGTKTINPTFDSTSASIHTRLALRFVEGLLGPGESRNVSTELGQMEWTWTTDKSDSLGYFSSVAWNHSGFLAIAHNVDGNGKPSVLKSEDGIGWTGVQVPEGIESFRELHAFGSGWVSAAWRSDQPVLVFYDGINWKEISLLSVDQDGFVDIAVSGDQILAVIARWTDDGFPDESRAVLIGSDLIPVPASMPTEYDWFNHNLGLAGNEDGFLLAMEDSFQSSSLTVWHTTDGDSWSVVSESSSIDDAMTLFNMQGHQSQYFVVGQTLERRCFKAADGETCSLPLGLWASPDGDEWARLITRGGEPVAAYTIGAGELGLVAAGNPFQDMSTPSIVYVSTDGASWEQLGDLSLYLPAAHWWNISNVAVGVDTIVISGSSYAEDGREPSENHFLIVGRVVGP